MDRQEIINTALDAATVLNQLRTCTQLDSVRINSIKRAEKNLRKLVDKLIEETPLPINTVSNKNGQSV